MLYNMETLKNSTRQVTLDELISLQEGFPANHTALQENERAKKMTDTSGQRCCALFENAPRATSWGKTFAALLVGTQGWYSKRCALTWKLKGTPSNRSYFQLQVSVLPTDEIAFGLLPTVKTTDHHKQRTLDENGENRSHTTGTKYGLHLTQMAEAGMLPTPTAFDYNTPRSQEAWDKAKEKHGDALQNPLKQMASFGMLPTPTSRDYKGARSREALEKAGRNHTNSLSDAFAKLGKTSQLSPLFVEEMMGFPKNWTALPFQSGDEKA